jgi:glutaminyl-peptide cyclotransferase
MKTRQIIAIVLIALFVLSIGYISFFRNVDPPVKPSKTGDKKEVRQEIQAPEFNADSGYYFVRRQVEFGPRVPGSKAHQSCGDWMVTELTRCGARVTEQKTTLKMFDGKAVPVRNIIAAFQPDKKNRILLCAHWDTRPFADKDPDKSKWNKPIDGANDGGSGVGVLLEIARIMAQKPTESGIDIIFFDVEDAGSAEFKDPDVSDVLNEKFISSWCLGSQHWGLNKHLPNYNPKFGILLDMVGATNAQFNQEKYSLEIGTDIVRLVWNTADKLGYGQYFSDKEVEGVIDDHYMVSRAGIRCIDIIDTRPQVSAMGLNGYVFGPYHHTHKDNMDVIDKEVLKAVGQTVLQVIYNQ